MAAAIPVSLAAVNLAKAFVFAFALALLLAGLVRGRRLAWLTGLHTPLLVTAMLAVLALSLCYTAAPFEQGVHDLGKYGKLLVIPLVLVLVRSRREAQIALAVFAVAQTFVVITSYLLFVDPALPWVPASHAVHQSIGTVYSSYIDQSIMTAGLAALSWHLRSLVPFGWGAKLAVALAAVCAVNVFFFLPGRSGQAALLAVVALTLLWAVPRYGKWLAVAVPPLLLALAMAGSHSFRDRIDAIVVESQAYQQGDPAPTSTGVRLNYWQRSIEMIEQRPFTGWGVGSWNEEYRRLEGPNLRKDAADLRNPHQEYLMWGAQLGLGGIAMLIAFLATAARDARAFAPEIRRATWCMVAILAVVCLFNATLFDALIGDYFCLMLGLLLALGTHAQDTPATQVPA